MSERSLIMCVSKVPALTIRRRAARCTDLLEIMNTDPYPCGTPNLGTIHITMVALYLEGMCPIFSDGVKIVRQLAFTRLGKLKLACGV